MAVQRRSSGLVLLLAVGSICAISWLQSLAAAFVQGPPALRLANRNQQLLQRATASMAAESAAGQEAKAAEGGQDVDDAVLQMALAMSQEEDELKVAPEEEKKEGFDFNNIVTGFWICLIIYSFGSSIIGVTQGRIQDRNGGDFTPYDFFDNIFVFSEWNLEYTLGFDPMKVLDGLKSGGAAPPAV
eukprot:CAMPEP_0115091604 /NCGR_PEP_ID=MMETSP0227-20121206/26215_1 /TAXON_ID=89957 /ORGANISM="Polarella glacialis, Strain CCMP 1383" /LENGTH=185 /DNA_ID=CAMNT_0002483155 /DNA_START=76 /DNA_END=633 /DNA_ORIENTATION=+